MKKLQRKKESTWPAVWYLRTTTRPFSSRTGASFLYQRMRVGVGSPTASQRSLMLSPVSFVMFDSHLTKCSVPSTETTTTTTTTTRNSVTSSSVGVASVHLDQTAPSLGWSFCTIYFKYIQFIFYQWSLYFNKKVWYSMIGRFFRIFRILGVITPEGVIYPSLGNPD